MPNNYDSINDENNAAAAASSSSSSSGPSRPSQSNGKVRVSSFDADGCLFNKKYSSNGCDVIDANITLLNMLKDENALFDDHIVFIGSNRQSFSMDRENRAKMLKALNKEQREKIIHAGAGSIFYEIEKIGAYLSAKVDKSLLSDFCGIAEFNNRFHSIQELADGESFDRGMKCLQGTYKGWHSEWYFDDTKATILYAQMHRAALEHPNKEIVFDFYDDRGFNYINEVDILEQLEALFTKHPDLIPQNVTLNLHHYTGGEVISKQPIKGIWIIDENYRQTVRDMNKAAFHKMGMDESAWWTKLKVADHITPEDLPHVPAYTPPAKTSYFKRAVQFTLFGAVALAASALTCYMRAQEENDDQPSLN